MNLHKLLFPKKESRIELLTDFHENDLKVIDKMYEDSKKIDLDKIYNDNKDFFQDMLVREFVGYVPKDVNEPTLKFFADNAAMFQKWILWQSHYINRKSIHDPMKIFRYEGMMVYLAVLHKLTSASTNITPLDVAPTKEKEPETPVVEKELEALREFKNGIQNLKNPEGKASENT